MSRGDPYRSSASSLAGDGGGGGGGRWDPDRFYRERERYERGGGRFVEERNIVEQDGGHRFERHDRHEDEYGRRLSTGHDHFEPERERFRGGGGGGGGGGEARAQIAVSGRVGRSGNDRYAGARGRLDEDKLDVYYEDERSNRPRRDSAFYEDDHEAAGATAMIPYRSGPPRGRRQSIHIEKEYVSPPAPRGPPPRPRYTRRPSSLDTHDRRPLPRYGDHEEFRAVVTVPTPSKATISGSALRGARVPGYPHPRARLSRA